MELLESLGIARELTGKRRNRLFVYERYLDVLSEGTEPPQAAGRGPRAGGSQAVQRSWAGAPGRLAPPTMRKLRVCAQLIKNSRSSRVSSRTPAEVPDTMASASRRLLSWSSRIFSSTVSLAMIR